MNTSIATPLVPKTRASKVQSDEEPESPSTEICQSPSWSDHGEEKRRKEKKKKMDKKQKEQLELEKRQKKEEDKQKNAAVRAGKRLSKKPPPAAMETQRMPSALRQTMTDTPVSPQASSNDSHRSWKDDRRSSLTSMVSFMGFSKPSSRRNSLSQPPSPALNVPGVSPTRSQPEKAPSIVDSPRQGQSNVHSSESLDGEKLYDKDIAEFAYQLEAAAKLDQIHDPKPLKQVRITSPSQVAASDSPSSNRKSKDTNSPDARRDGSAEKKPLRPILVNRDNSDSATTKKLGAEQENFGPTQERTPSLDKDTTVKAATIDDLAKYRGIRSAVTASINTPSAPLPRGRQSYDGNSYVHKQRMHHQQRSIDGYQDELALLRANETLEKGWNRTNQHQIWPPTPQDSAESLDHGGALPNQKKIDNNEKMMRNDVSPLTTTTPQQSEAHVAKTDCEPLNIHTRNKSESKSRDAKSSENSAKRDGSRKETGSSKLISQDLQSSTVCSGSAHASVRPAEHQDIQLQSAQANVGNSGKPLHDQTAENGETIETAHGKKGSISKEVVIEGVDGDGLVRKTSLKRPRSDPQIQVSTSVPTLPSLDFLPELKHQPLTKPKRTSHLRTSYNGTTEAIAPMSSSQFPVSSSTFSTSMSARVSDPQSIVKLPFAPPRPRAESPTKPSNIRSSSSNPSQMLLHPSHPIPAMDSALAPKPIAKMFVICCKCKYWHDLPSRLYEALALPRKIQPGDKIAQSGGAKTGSERKGKDVEGKVFTTVNCPWCAHGMNTACCAGWTTVVYLHERHH